MRGGIEVTSEPGRGATFEMQFPLAQPGALRAAAAPAFSPRRMGETAVLVVDDDAGVRCMVAELLRKNGLLVLEAGDAAAARTAFEEHLGHLHLLCSDVDLPDQDGFEMAEELLTLSPATRVVFMTGATAARAPEGRLGHARILRKPLDGATLLEAVAHALRDA
jgi:DNA-binding NtrC family response regulator